MNPGFVLNETIRISTSNLVSDDWDPLMEYFTRDTVAGSPCSELVAAPGHRSHS